jgi:L-ascorbate metabolism protein UlaG (beta-lactamase superfamily)
MKLIGEEGIDLAILPIGDNFTMGPADALRAVMLIEPARVVPCHYDTFEVIKQDPHAWAAEVERETCARVTVMAPGATIEV